MFGKIENTSLKNYGLCPSHYLSAPGLSWDAMLNMTKIKLELIWNPDMYIFLEESTRGGISYIYNRYNKINNKHSKTYGPKQESRRIIYIDTNSLYGDATSKFLLTSGL